jgi:hypothetical protein
LEPPVTCSDDFVGVRLPDKWFWIAGIVFPDEAIDGGLEIDKRMEDAVLEPPAGELCEKPSTALSHEHEVGVKWNVQRG